MRPCTALVIASTAALVAALSGSTWAQGQPNRAEQHLKYRKAVYQVIAWNIGPLSAMAQDNSVNLAATEAVQRDLGVSDDVAKKLT